MYEKRDKEIYKEKDNRFFSIENIHINIKGDIFLPQNRLFLYFYPVDYLENVYHGHMRIALGTYKMVHCFLAY